MSGQVNIRHKEQVSAPSNVHELPFVKSAPAAPLKKTPRPGHWRVDLKWIFGTPFTIILMSTLVVLSLFTISSRGNATQAIAEMNSQVLVDQQLMADLSTNSPQLAALLREPDFAKIVYEEPSKLDEAVKTAGSGAGGQAGGLPAGAPPEAVQEAQAQRSEQANGVSSLVQPVKMLGAPFHETLGAILTVQLLLLLLTGIPFILFSRRAGKLVSPALSLAMASWLPLLVLFTAHSSAIRWIEGKQSAGASEEEKLTALLAGVLRPFVENLFGGAISVYRFGAFISVTLLVAAAVVFTIIRVRERAHAGPVPVHKREAAA